MSESWCFAQDLSFKERHWHEECFVCSSCGAELANKPFSLGAPEKGAAERVFCPDCYDAAFSSKCDGCAKPFKSGSPTLFVLT